MNLPGTETDLASALLDYLRRILHTPNLAYAEPPVAVEGGFETLIYGFRLQGATEELSRPLILRVFREDTGGERSRFETAVQNGVADFGYPAPRVLVTCSDKEAVGGAFLIMERLPGRIMLESFFRPSPLLFRLPGILAETQARLHSLDPAPLLRAIEAAGFPARRVGMEAWMEQIKIGVEGASMGGLRPGLRWILEHQPPEPEEPVICHGDFHPLNVLMVDGTVSGVIDWGWVMIGDPAYDVGATIALFTQGPTEIPAPLRGTAGVIRRLLIQRYYRAYQRRRPVEAEAVSYHEALRCLGFLVEASEHRLGEAGVIERPLKPSAFAAPYTVKSVVSRFRKITGVALTVPSDS